MNLNFCLPDQNGKKVCLENFKGKWTIVYFYPKDDTPGCTIEAIDFTKKIDEFKKLNCEIVGISPDHEKSHCNFIEKHKLKITLLCDPEMEVAKKFKAYRKIFFGIIRSTFIINPKGEIIYSWKNVKAEGHVDEVLNKLKELN